jgi:hypothetical protein
MNDILAKLPSLSRNLEDSSPDTVKISNDAVAAGFSVYEVVRPLSGAAIVAYRSHSDGFSAPDPVVHQFRRLRFPPMSITTDALRIDFIVPHEARFGNR